MIKKSILKIKYYVPVLISLTLILSA
ncbi:hypothetical protein FKY78_14640 [Enterococcus faecalis]|uniref:Uncharacterized protein n=2 Tax=Enterococcus faecalis TaxID=1351 RepID=Q82YN5_ENTFA|nr:hypothetical protein EF_B00051 [Enterococcus faecalis V583]AVR90408.1 hypothetical protein CEQ02_00150 [Enterococcus faecalis]MVH72515.1 hypothetical protein [Staphylococcus aureus]EGO8390096.1 hypothetical protein [Enterococcus faecalis]EGO8447289.1 hypothetical protein [Enterococcus faecalis]